MIKEKVRISYNFIKSKTAAVAQYQHGYMYIRTDNTRKGALVLKAFCNKDISLIPLYLMLPTSKGKHHVWYNFYTVELYSFITIITLAFVTHSCMKKKIHIDLMRSTVASKYKLIWSNQSSKTKGFKFIVKNPLNVHKPLQISKQMFGPFWYRQHSIDNTAPLPFFNFKQSFR